MPDRAVFVSIGPWVEKLRKKALVISAICPDGRKGLRATRGRDSQDTMADWQRELGYKTQVEIDILMGQLLASWKILLLKIDGLLARQRARDALNLLDSWLAQQASLLSMGCMVHHQLPPDAALTRGLPLECEAELLRRRAIALAATGESKRADADCRRLLVLQPTDPWPLARLGKCHAVRAKDGVQGQAAEAVTAMIAALDKDPTSVRGPQIVSEMAHVRMDREYRPWGVKQKGGFPSALEVLGGVETVAGDARLRKKYQWETIDVSDLVRDQQALRQILLSAADKANALKMGNRELGQLTRTMNALGLPRGLIQEVTKMCADGEIDEDDRGFLMALLPPDQDEQLKELVRTLRECEVTLLSLFRYYCYTSGSGSGGAVEANTSVVSQAQFKLLVKDCGLLHSTTTLDVHASLIDQIFLRAMFRRGDSYASDERPVGLVHTSSQRTLGSSDTQRALQLYEFVGALVRLANSRYPTMLPQGLSAKFLQFKLDCIDRIANVPGLNLERMENLVRAAPIVAVLSNVETKLGRVFNVYCTKDVARASSNMKQVKRELHKMSGSGQETMNVNEYEQFCRDAGLISGHGHAGMLSKTDARNIFVEVITGALEWPQMAAMSTVVRHEVHDRSLFSETSRHELVSVCS